MLIFQTSKEPWLLKDLEKTASKEHGVVLQSVKDIVDSLVSDGLVNCEKIGTSNYFWSFPSTAAAARTAQLNTLEARIKDLQDKKEKLEEGIKQQLDEGRQESVNGEWEGRRDGRLRED